MKRRLAAILCADMVGCSRRMAIGETGTLLRFKQHREQVIDPAIARGRGWLVKSTGDGVLAEFPSVVDAIPCAVAIRLDLASRNDPLGPGRARFSKHMNSAHSLQAGICPRERPAHDVPPQVCPANAPRPGASDRGV